MKAVSYFTMARLTCGVLLWSNTLEMSSDTSIGGWPFETYMPSSPLQMPITFDCNSSCPKLTDTFFNVAGAGHPIVGAMQNRSHSVPDSDRVHFITHVCFFLNTSTKLCKFEAY